MLWAAGLVGAALGASTGASIQLAYTAPPSCPGVAHLKAQLGARLGYDPVREPATQQVVVIVEERDDGLVAALRIGDANERVFPGGPNDCESLLSSATLALAIALDPVTMMRARKPASPAGRATESAGAPAEPKVAAPFALTLSVGLRSSIALLPQVSTGPTAELRLGWRSFSFALEAGAGFALPMRVEGGRVDTSLVRAGANACAHASFVAVCLRGTAGALSAVGSGFESSRRGWLPVATVGPAFGAEWSPVGQCVLKAALELDLNLQRNIIGIGDRDVWRSGLFGGSLTLSAGWRFL